MNEKSPPQFEQLISRVAKPLLEKNSGMNDVFRWIEKHKEEFLSLLNEIDTAVITLNSLSMNETPEMYKNIKKVKQAFGDRPLPLISELVAQGKFIDMLHFKTNSQDMRGMMKRGEEKDKIEPYLTFQIQRQITQDPEARVIGALIHFLDEYWLNYAQTPMAIHRGELADALIEALSLNPATKMWDAVSNGNRLDWVNGWQGFSSEFREKNRVTFEQKLINFAKDYGVIETPQMYELRSQIKAAQGEQVDELINNYVLLAQVLLDTFPDDKRAVAQVGMNFLVANLGYIINDKKRHDQTIIDAEITAENLKTEGADEIDL